MKGDFSTANGVQSSTITQKIKYVNNKPSGISFYDSLTLLDGFANYSETSDTSYTISYYSSEKGEKFMDVNITKNRQGRMLTTKSTSYKTGGKTYSMETYEYDGQNELTKILGQQKDIKGNISTYTRHRGVIQRDKYQNPVLIQLTNEGLQTPYTAIMCTYEYYE